MAHDGQFRNANDYAVTQGFLSGYPNFQEASYGAGVVHVRWPFDPDAPPPAKRRIEDGVYGSIVSDKPHVPKDDSPLKDAVERWKTGTGNHEHNRARCRPVTQFLRGVAVVAPGTFTGRPRVETLLDVHVAVPPKPRPGAVLRFREFVGPKTPLDTILEGNPAKTGAAITPSANPDGIRVRVRVGGKKSVLGGSDGRFPRAPALGEPTGAQARARAKEARARPP